MFIMASSSNMISPLFLGLVLDRFGPRACSVTSVAFSTLGFFLFGTAAMLAPALSSSSSSITGMSREDLFSLSVVMIGFGGPGVQNAVIHTANLFPSHKGLVTAIITGCFQLSFIVFFVFDQVRRSCSEEEYLGVLGVMAVLSDKYISALIVYHLMQESIDSRFDKLFNPSSYPQIWYFGGINYKTIFVTYGAICFFCLGTSIFLWPDKPFQVRALN